MSDQPERRGTVMVDGKEVLAWPEDGGEETAPATVDGAEQQQPQPEEEQDDDEDEAEAAAGEGKDAMGEERPGSSSSSAALSRLGSRQGSKSKGLTNLNKEKELRPKTGSVKVGSGATARVVRLTDISQDPRPLRRKRRLPSNRALLPYDPFTATDEDWEACARGRGGCAERFPHEASFSVLSYQVLSQERTAGITYVRDNILNWSSRRWRLLEEVVCYAADFVCLQDVDNYREFWQPRLNEAGYDSVYHRRTQKIRPRSEGVLVAWNRDLFSLFRSESINFNDQFEELRARDPVLAMDSLQDNVGLLVQLQPWQDGYYPSALTLACLNFCADPAKESVRAEQAGYFLRKLATFNGDYATPVVVAGGLETRPMSRTYEIIATGERPKDPGPPQKPGNVPSLELDSRSSVRVKWKAPPLDLAAFDPPIEGYWVAWRPGGNRNLGWKEKKYVTEDAATIYDLVPQPGGGTRTVKNEWFTTVVSGLSSGVPVEFRFAAVNELGTGPWSEPSKAIQTRNLSDTYAPANDALLNIDEFMLRLAQGDLPLQALLLAAKEHRLITAQEITALRTDMRDGRHSEFHHVKATLQLLRENRVNPGPFLKAWRTSEVAKDPTLEAYEKNRALHPYAGLHNLSPRFLGGAPNGLTAPVRRQMLPFFPSATGVTVDDGALPKLGNGPGDGMVGDGTISAAMSQRSQRSQRSDGSRRSNAIEDGGAGGPEIGGDFFGLDLAIEDGAMGGGESAAGSGGGNELAALSPLASPLVPDFDDEADQQYDQAQEEQKGGGGGGGGGGDLIASASAPLLLPPSSSSSSSPSALALPRGAVDAFDLPGELDEVALVEAEMRRDQQLALGNIANKPKANNPYEYVPPKDVPVTGTRNDRQAHKLLLRSAYDRYSWDGEPPMTAATAEYIGTLDYIMYSKEKLVPRALLSLPDLDDIVNDDPRELEMTPDEACGEEPPDGWVAALPGNGGGRGRGARGGGHQAPLNYTGEWVCPIKENERKTHHYLPNREYPSNHLALMVEFTFLREGMESDWTEKRVVNPIIKSS